VKANTAGSRAHPSADFEELSAQGFNLGGTPRERQLDAKEVNQVISGRVQEQAEGASQKTVAAQAIGAKAVFEFFDAILTLAAIVVESEDFGSKSGAVSGSRSAGWFR